MDAPAAKMEYEWSMDADDPDLPGAAIEHISQPQPLAKAKHQLAIELLSSGRRLHDYPKRRIQEIQIS